MQHLTLKSFRVDLDLDLEFDLELHLGLDLDLGLVGYSHHQNVHVHVNVNAGIVEEVAAVVVEHGLVARPTLPLKWQSKWSLETAVLLGPTGKADLCVHLHVHVHVHVHWHWHW